MKRKILVCSLIVICLAITAFSTTAYFVHEDQAANVITAGNVNISLRQWRMSADGEKKEPFDGLLGIMPGKEIHILPEIENIGSQPAWIRVSVEKTIELAQGITGETDVSLISLNIDTENWIEKDGYYYYKEKLKAGEIAKPLYNKAAFSAHMKNQYQDSQITIEIYVEATQSKNNGDTVMDAGGWPKK